MRIVGVLLVFAVLAGGQDEETTTTTAASPEETTTTVGAGNEETTTTTTTTTGAVEADTTTTTVAAVEGESTSTTTGVEGETTSTVAAGGDEATTTRAPVEGGTTTVAARGSEETTSTTVAAGSEETTTTTASVEGETTTTTTSVGGGYSETTTTTVAAETTTTAGVTTTTRATTTVVTTTTTTTTTIKIFAGGLLYDASGVTIQNQTSYLPPALVFPVSQIVNFSSLSATEFTSLYCQSSRIVSYRPLATIGDSGARYQQAALQAISAALVERGRIRTHRDSRSSFHETVLRAVRKMRVSSFLQLSPITYGKCLTDADCGSLGRRKYCIENVCRECSPSSWMSDCPNTPDASMCSAATGYTCSQCLDDSGCSLVGGSCRFVFPGLNVSYPMMPRLVCTICPQVPLSAEIFDASLCLWRCPVGTVWNGQSACIAAPTCSATQFFGLSNATNQFYYPRAGVNMTNPVCKECSNIGPINDPNFCATIVDPANLTGVVGAVGSLDQVLDTGLVAARPCGSFTCKPGYYLNSLKNRCIQCNYAACDGGFTLSGCGGDQAGTCVPCPADNLVPNSDWLNVRMAGSVNITKPSVTCSTVCKFGFHRKTTTSQCLACDEIEKTKCGVGKILNGCGPGQGTGTCESCPPPAFNMYFTGNKCQQAPCTDKAALCPPGTALQGCGGSSSGQCVACPTALPGSAVTWKSGCDFLCAPGYYANKTSNTCNQCDSGTQCGRGQYVVGCGIDGVSNGTCTKCPPLGRGLYYAPGKGCDATRCNPLTCASDQKLVGCGYGEVGFCTSCGAVPAGIHSLSRHVTVGTVRQCAPSCNAGFQIAENATNPLGYSCRPIEAIDLIYEDNGFL